MQERAFVLFEKNIVLKADGSLPEFSEFEKIKAENPLLEYFEEKQTGIKVLGLSSAEKLGNAYKTIPLREFFALNNLPFSKGNTPESRHFRVFKIDFHAFSVQNDLV